MREDLTTQEELREFIALLEAKLDKERTHRILLETTLEGLERMTLVEGVEQAFTLWTDMATPLLDFEHAFVLSRREDDEVWQVSLATHPALYGLSWPHGPWFERVLVASSPSAFFNASYLPAWLAMRHELEGVSLPQMTSLLLMPLQWGSSKALMVCTHPQPARFPSSLRQTYQQLSVLASQVFASLMHRSSRVERDAALRADQAKSRFLASMSHELRTPLNIIIGYGELILEESEEEDYGRHELRDDLGRLLSSARHLLQIVGNVLDLSRIEQDRVSLSMEVFDLDVFIGQLVQDIKPLIEARNNTFRLEKSHDILPAWRGDRLRIRQVLFNLLANAAKFTSDGQIALSIHRHEDGLRMSVRDTGSGITQAHLHRIFELFERVDGAHGEQEGAGPGLPISKRLAQIMDGELSVESEQGVGSCFSLYLPLLGREG